MELMDKVVAECKRNDNCKTCRIVKGNGGCSLLWPPPDEWDIEAIRRVLEEESDKEEIVVPKKWAEEKLEEMPFGEPYDMVHDIMKKQNKIIECLEQIKERMRNERIQGV